MTPSPKTSPAKPPSNWAQTYFGPNYLKLHAGVFFPPALSSTEARFVLRHARIRRGGLVLDVPCGFGRHLAGWAKGGLRPVGLEIQLPYLHHARRLLKSKAIPLVQADMGRIPLADASFDAVAHLFNSFGYFPDKSPTRRPQPTNQSLLAEFHRILKPGGALVIDAPERSKILRAIRDSPERLETGPDWSVKQRYRYNETTRRLENRTEFTCGDATERCAYSIRLFSPSELRRRLEQAGFVIEKFFRAFDDSSIPDPENDRGTMLYFARKPLAGR